ncbi:hypothetical protein QAD02_008451 [Eretmocerus hayati]|uniref:Uncharacterized protein n=1 Tax=Eretmocerus hayati TaxID=131215 RepID=A0ACC2N6F6_9HYME|nr:hypothetical protein QAD02_008451 [Eretmocerus hayati]
MILGPVWRFERLLMILSLLRCLEEFVKTLGPLWRFERFLLMIFGPSWRLENLLMILGPEWRFERAVMPVFLEARGVDPEVGLRWPSDLMETDAPGMVRSFLWNF